MVLIDYSLNDRRIGLEAASEAWTTMIRMSLDRGVKVILLTSTSDLAAQIGDPDDPLERQASQVRRLASEWKVGLVDSLEAFRRASDRVTLSGLMSQNNHPNAAGHKLVAAEILKYLESKPLE
ncbi:MAG: SGNH/GDSL hydrolase family protein [Candidatus Solibacter sp.]|nr:SGNH/GDSL hydrolase family protein [Candidatus Solibacter sp.]